VQQQHAAVASASASAAAAASAAALPRPSSKSFPHRKIFSSPQPKGRWQKFAQLTTL